MIYIQVYGTLIRRVFTLLFFLIVGWIGYSITKDEFMLIIIIVSTVLFVLGYGYMVYCYYLRAFGGRFGRLMRLVFQSFSLIIDTGLSSVITIALWVLNPNIIWLSVIVTIVNLLVSTFAIYKCIPELKENFEVIKMIIEIG